MTIKKMCIIIIIVIIVSLISIIFIFNDSKDSFNNLKGSIIVGNLNEKNKYDIFILNLESQDKKYIDSSVVQNSSFAGNNKQLLNNINNEIYLYDIESGENILICKVSHEYIENVRYINKDYISFFSEGKLVLFNIKTKKEKIIINKIDDNKYSYSPYTNKFYFSNKCKIYECDLETLSKKYIIEGYEPVISKRGNILAYINWDFISSRNYLNILNINTGDIWKTEIIYPNAFTISPDESYIAITKEYDGLKFIFFSKETFIYDYKNRKKITIIDHGSYDFALDWI